MKLHTSVLYYWNIQFLLKQQKEEELNLYFWSSRLSVTAVQPLPGCLALLSVHFNSNICFDWSVWTAVTQSQEPWFETRDPQLKIRRVTIFKWYIQSPKPSHWLNRIPIKISLGCLSGSRWRASKCVQANFFLKGSILSNRLLSYREQNLNGESWKD